MPCVTVCYTTAALLEREGPGHEEQMMIQFQYAAYYSRLKSHLFCIDCQKGSLYHEMAAHESISTTGAPPHAALLEVRIVCGPTPSAATALDRKSRHLHRKNTMATTMVKT